MVGATPQGTCQSEDTFAPFRRATQAGTYSDPMMCNRFVQVVQSALILKPLGVREARVGLPRPLSRKYRDHQAKCDVDDCHHTVNVGDGTLREVTVKERTRENRVVLGGALASMATRAPPALPGSQLWSHRRRRRPLRYRSTSARAKFALLRMKCKELDGPNASPDS